MSSFKNKWFSLVELLVVITILSIISIVAYTSFSWTTDKAKNAKKDTDLASIETWLQSFFQAKNYYPMPTKYDSNTNVWGYDSAKTAQVNNTFTGSKTWDQYDWVTPITWEWGWKVNNKAWTTQIWAKWTFWSSTLPKEYLSQALYDPHLKDVKVWDNKTFKDYWIWEYVYWVYAKSDFSPASQKWTAYNIAATLKDDQKWFVTKLIWNFDSSTCPTCPDSLIWPWWSESLKDWESSLTGSSLEPLERIPYPIAWF